MKIKNKKLTNKDFENRDNILMMEVENLKRVFDSVFTAFVDYVEYKGDMDNLKKYMEEKETKDVRPELQKPSS